MKTKLFLSILLTVFAISNLYAQEEKLFQGFDGGMMVHTGFISGSIPGLGYEAKGMPAGIGGVIRLHLGEHFRVGSEGYVSTLKQRGNGSYVKYGWGGILADFCWRFGRLMPYAGLTVGGGSNSYLLMTGEQVPEGKPLQQSYFHKRGFFALDPFVGCDYIVSEAFHLTLKADWLQCIKKGYDIPSGPKLYIGFIFYH